MTASKKILDLRNGNAVYTCACGCDVSVEMPKDVLYRYSPEQGYYVRNHGPRHAVEGYAWDGEYHSTTSAYERPLPPPIYPGPHATGYPRGKDHEDADIGKALDDWFDKVDAQTAFDDPDKTPVCRTNPLLDEGPELDSLVDTFDVRGPFNGRD